MSRRAKNLLLIGGLLGVLVVVLYASVAVVVPAGFAQLEDWEVRQNVRRVLNALSAEVSNLATLTGDYAGWDDTYAFVADRNEEYISTNLIDSTFAKLRLNAMLFVHSSGRIVYSKGYDWQSERQISVPATLSNQVFPGSRLLLHASTDSQISGVLLLPEGALLIASRPILTSEYQGPIRGTLIFARYFDAAEIERLAKRTDLSLSAQGWDELQAPSDFQRARAAFAQGATTFVFPLDDATVAGYALLSDVYAKPALILRVEQPREIHTQAQTTLRYLLGVFALIGLTSGIVFLWMYTRVERSRSDVAALQQAQAALRRRDAILRAVSFAAEQFLKSPASEQNIRGVLARLGQAADVSRVYLFENHTVADGTLLSSRRYEWVASGITPQNDNPELQNLAWEKMGVTRWVETMRRHQVIHAHVRNLPPRERALLEPQEIKSILEVPIFADQTWWGFIGFDECRAEREWTTAEIDALKAAADTLSAAIERRRVDQELRSRIRYFFLLNEITQAGITASDWKQMLQILADRAGELLQADGCHITLWDQARRTTMHGAAYGPLRTVYASLPADTGVTLTSSVLAAGHAIPIEDTSQSPYLSPHIAAKYPFRALLGLPLIVGEQKLGALIVAFQSRRRFSLEEIARGEQAAGQVALALAQARLLTQTRQRAEQLAMLNEIGRAVSTLSNVDRVLEVIYEQAQRVLPLQVFYVALYDPETHLVSYPIVYDDGARFHEASDALLADSTLGKTILYGQAHIIHRTPEQMENIRNPDSAPDSTGERAPRAQERVMDDARASAPETCEPFYPFGNRARVSASLLFAPLQIGVRIIGAISVQSYQLNAYQPEHLTLLTGIAHQAAIAIENARLFAAAQQRAAELDAIRQATLGLTSSLDLTAVLDAILANALQLVKGSRDAHIYLYQDQRLTFGASLCTDRQKGRQLAEPRRDGLTYTVAQRGEAIVVPDIRQHPLFANTPDDWIGAIVGLPLKMGGRVVGVMNVAYTHPHDIPETELRALRLLADQAAIAIANAWLFAETQRRALEQTIVSEIARAFNAALDTRQAFPTLVQGIRRLIPSCERVSLALLGDTAEYYTIFLLDQPRIELAEGTQLPVSTSAAATDLLTGRIHLTPDLAAELDFPGERMLYEAGFRSRINIPLSVGARGLGALNLASREVAAFNKSHFAVLEQIASTVAIAIENWRLFDTEQHRRSELTALYDLSRTLVGAFELDTVLHHIVCHSVQTVRTTFARIALLEEETFIVRAAHPARLLSRDLELGSVYSKAPRGLVWQIMQGTAPVVVEREDARLDAAERAWLLLDLARALLVVPLHVGERIHGVLLLGEERHQGRESFNADKVRLARSIGDQAASAIHRAELYAELERAYLQAVLALANAVDAKDTATGDHSQRLADLALAIGREVGLSPRALEDLRYGAILHDIGKIGVPDAVLLKPAELDTDEWTRMHQHPSIGAKILAPLPRLAGAAEIVQNHHEWYDGTGYPAGLVGEAIPLGARILAIVDAYGAIIDERVYKPARSSAEALAEIRRAAGTQFDPRLVEIFLRVLERQRESQR